VFSHNHHSGRVKMLAKYIRRGISVLMKVEYLLEFPYNYSEIHGKCGKSLSKYNLYWHVQYLQIYLWWKYK